MIFGIPYILLIALAVYMVSTVLVTEFLKKYLDVEPLILSWFVGIIVYVILFIFIRSLELMSPVEKFYSVILFIVITALLNTSYKNFRWLKELARKWVGSELS